jgi:copper chaperone CopZ
MINQNQQQVNTSCLVHRVLQVPSISSDKCIEKINNTLQDLPGVTALEIVKKKEKIIVTYDVSQVLFNDIKKTLAKMNCLLSKRWWLKIRYAIYQYQDENIRDNASAGDGSCCNNPTDVYAKRRRR